MSTGVQRVKKLEAFLREELNDELPQPDIDLMAEGYLDSLLFLKLLLFLENEFEIRIEFSQFEFDNFQTINKIMEFVENQDFVVEPS